MRNRFWFELALGSSYWESTADWNVPFSYLRAYNIPYFSDFTWSHLALLWSEFQCFSCWQKFPYYGLWTGLWLNGVGRGKSQKACRQTFGTAVPRYPAVHQIMMQAPIGENTDCWQVWLTSAFRSARSTQFDHRVAITKQSKDYYHGEELCDPVKRLKLSLKKH